MSNDMEVIKYFMAAEKVHGLMGAMDRLIEFTDEFKITPDEEVKKALKPYVDKLNDWIKD